MNATPLQGQVAIVTGAGRGLGRAHALALAEQGAAVVVNDVGADVHGQGSEALPAQQVVAEITAQGGQAVASYHDISDWTQAAALIDFAVESFGDLNVLVNNAGILRDRMLANMSESEWDDVIRVHLKGHAAPTRHAVAYWRGQAKTGRTLSASVVHTTSASGFIGAFGQANYAAAKLGVIGLSNTVATEYGGIGVRSNVISPVASSRMGQTSQVTVQSQLDSTVASLFDPTRVATVVAWLSQPSCPATGQVLHVFGRRVLVLGVGEVLHEVDADEAWTLPDLDVALSGRLATRMTVDDYIAEDGLAVGTAVPAAG